MLYEVIIPIKGKSEGLPVEQQPLGTSGDMNNVRPRDVLERKIRLGQRGGFVKAYNESAGNNVTKSVVCMVQVVTVE